MSNDDEEWRKRNELRPVENLGDAVEHLMNALDWLDANGQRMAAMHINQALEVLLEQGGAPPDQTPGLDGS